MVRTLKLLIVIICLSPLLACGTPQSNVSNPPLAALTTIYDNNFIYDPRTDELIVEGLPALVRSVEGYALRRATICPTGYLMHGELIIWRGTESGDAFDLPFVQYWARDFTCQAI